MRGARAIFGAFLVVASALSVSLVAPPAAAWINVTPYMTGLDFPIALAFAPPPDNRTFFAERFTGSIRIIDKNGSLLPDPFYTLSNTTGDGERGLLGLALDPAFPGSPYVYAYQTFDDGPNGIVNRIVRILADGNSGVSHEEIFRTPPLSGATNHNGGVIAFGSDDRLYALVGENAQPPLSQDPMSPMGKVLRMNTDGSAPPDNPFADNSSWNPLVYTYGHRNMFGLAFHPKTDGIFVTENGPECNDEVNLLSPGRNFGWGPSEACASPPDINTTNRDGPDPVLPVWWWARTICPTNAAIYDGPDFPAWQGDLFMGDCNTATLHRLHLRAPDYTVVESDEPVYPASGAVLDVEAGPDGAIWFTTPTAIYRLWDSGVPPQAAFDATPNPVVVGTPVLFNASASRDPDGTIVSYAWNFGDGNQTESGPTPTHTYRAPGLYQVRLEVKDNESYSSTALREIKVDQTPPAPIRPTARFTFHPSPAAPGVPVVFEARNSSDSDGRIVAYRWAFGDGAEGTGIQTAHAYSMSGMYTVALTVTDNDNLTGTTTHQVFVGQPPTAVIEFAPATIFIGTEVRFSGTGSLDTDGTIENWTWEFGDASGDAGPQVFHRYATKGRFTVNLTVEDNDGMTNRTSTRVDVRNRPPVIDSSGPAPGPVTLAAGTNRTFAVNASDPDGDALSYAWRVNDAAVGGTSRTLNFVPSGPGVYVVNVTVSDGTASAFREWTVTVSTTAARADGVLFGLISVAVVLIGIASAAVVVAWRRRRGRQKGPNGM